MHLLNISSYSSLKPAGRGIGRHDDALGVGHDDAFVDGFSETAFTDFMQDWEKRMNHYLTTGACLRS